RIAERYVFEIDLAARGSQPQRVRRVLDRRHRIEDGENLSGRSERTLHYNMEFTQGLDRVVDKENAGGKSEKTAGAQVGRVNVPKCKADPDRGDDLNQRSNRFLSFHHAHGLRE